MDDLQYVVDIVIGGLSHDSANRFARCPLHIYANRHSDSGPAYADSYANTNGYSCSVSHIHAGAARLPEAAGGLHTGRS